jgi:hypothetical protein
MKTIILILSAFALVSGAFAGEYGIHFTLDRWGAGLTSDPEKVFVDKPEIHAVGSWQPMELKINAAGSGLSYLSLSPLITARAANVTPQAGFSLSFDKYIDAGLVWNKRARSVYLSSSWPIDKLLGFIGAK